MRLYILPVPYVPMYPYLINTCSTGGNPSNQVPMCLVISPLTVRRSSFVALAEVVDSFFIRTDLFISIIPRAIGTYLHIIKIEASSGRIYNKIHEINSYHS